MTQETLLKYLLRIVPSVVAGEIVDSRAQQDGKINPSIFWGGW